jgi:hypothetical protein
MPRASLSIRKMLEAVYRARATYLYKSWDRNFRNRVGLGAGFDKMQAI